MSVLIKGMEMPTSCSECRFFVDAWCYAFKADDWRNAYNKPPNGERLDNCPLVPVPPHGRLIDADFLLAEYDRIYVGKPGGARLLIANAPTTIPEEEGE